MLEQTGEVFVTLLAIVLIYYLGTPLLILLGQKLPANPNYEILDFDGISAHIERFLKKQTFVLYDLGFSEPTLIHLPNQAPNVTSYLVMLVNRRAGDKAKVTAIIGRGIVTIQTLHIEFSTRFESGEAFRGCSKSGEFLKHRDGKETIPYRSHG